jgi:hypothetical protein
MPPIIFLALLAGGLFVAHGQPRSLASKAEHVSLKARMQDGQVFSVGLPKGWFSSSTSRMIELQTPKPGLEWSHGLFPRDGAIVRIYDSGIQVRPTQSDPQDNSVRLQIQAKLLPTKNYKLIRVEAKSLRVAGKATSVNFYEIEYDQISDERKQHLIAFTWTSKDRVMLLELIFLRPSLIENQTLAVVENLLATMVIR